MEAKLTNVFRRTAEAVTAALNGTGPTLICNQGGQGSSKTISTLQVIYNVLRFSNKPLPTTFCSYALPHLKQGVIKDFDNIVLPAFGENVGLVKSSPATPMYKIGKSEINCYGVEGNIAMAHGPRRKILYINECNRKISYEVFDQLAARSEITLVDFNPDQEFWLHDKVLPNFPHVIIRSNFMDNPYLPAGELNNILMKKDKPGFENWWRVYGLGELGKLEGLIFPNWQYGDFPSGVPYGFGLDFGFNDPDAMVKCYVDERSKTMFWDEQIYKSGNSSDDLRRIIGQRCSRNDLIIADSADARMIKELSRYYNVRATHKGKVGWSVPESIKIMQGYQHVITESSVNLAKEFNNYLWSDKKAGIPMAGFDHLIDAGRYWFQHSKTAGSGKQQWTG